MKIKYIAWKQIISSDVKRIIYGIRDGISNKGDQALQNFNSLGENPGLWSGFTEGKEIPDSPDAFPIPLANSKNDLKLWHSSNDGRQDPIKISMQIWDHEVVSRRGSEDNDHKKHIIETWYIAYMRILSQLLEKLISQAASDEKIFANEDTVKLKKIVDERLEILPDNIEESFLWICDTQDKFLSMRMDTRAFMADSNLVSIKAFVEDYYYLVIKYMDGEEEKNAALVANSNASNLHPDIKKLLDSQKSGGANVDIDVQEGVFGSEINAIMEKLHKEKNIILYGAPGTGKTRLMAQIEKAFTSTGNYDCMNTEAPISLDGYKGKIGVTKWCTFHPDYTYEEFVLGLNPQIIEGKLGYTYHKGPFLEQVLESQNGKRTLLIIDEINRANTDDVFGDTIRLLDKRGRGKVSVGLPKQVGVPEDKMVCGEDFYVIGTMNSLDKSVSPLTPELKRIFSIVEMMPDQNVLKQALDENYDIPDEFADLVVRIFVKVNQELRENVGKEYMLGQGYLWDLVMNGTDYEATFADILRHKIVPHLKDVYPEEKYLELFKPINHGVLFRKLDSINEMCSVEMLCDGALINAFAQICGMTYKYEEPNQIEFTTFDEYEKYRLDYIYSRLIKYKNVILAGPSGTGKSVMLEAIRDNYGFEKADIMYWHNSTGYDDVIEGISASVNFYGNDIEYSYSSGAVKHLAECAKGVKSLMGIENLDKSNAGENFGELITLLEPDKRASVSVEGYTGPICLPEDMHFLCTMNPVSMAQNKMDSALKRRFVILELYPDYKLLSLWFGVEENFENYKITMDTKEERLKLAVELLRAINIRITNSISVDAQVGHAVMWELKDTVECLVSDIANVFDETILPMIEDYCVDSDIAYKLLGQNSPLLKKRNFGVELMKFGGLSADEQVNAFKELIEGEI